MKKRYIILSIFALIPWCMIAQESLNKLQAPSSPASSVLGIQPSAILAPKSYQALETALFTNFTEDNNTVIPNDFALEFTPYWVKENHGLSLAEYLYPKSLADQFIRNSSFSLASTQNYLLGDSTASNSLAFGYRTTFYFGNKADRDKVQTSIDSLRKSMSITANIAAKVELATETEATFEQFKYKIAPIVKSQIAESKSEEEAQELTKRIFNAAEDSLITIYISDPDLFKNKFYSILDRYTGRNQVFKHFEEYIRNRYGFSVDVAYANALNFPTNQFEFSYAPKQSLWIAPTYRFENKLEFLKVTGLVRYDWYNQDYYKKYFTGLNLFQNSIDYGLSISGEFKKFSLNIEVVGRESKAEILAGMDSEGNQLYRKKSQSDIQYVGSFNYNLTQQTVLSYSLGNRFDPIVNPNSTFISTLTLNFAFGTPNQKSIDLLK